MSKIRWVCTRASFKPSPSKAVRWLAPQADFYRFQQSQMTRGVEPPTLETWTEWHENGLVFCGVTERGILRAYAAVLKHENSDWELMGVRTLEEFQKRGFATIGCSFITEYILRYNEVAACEIEESDEAMTRTLVKLGYH